MTVSRCVKDFDVDNNNYSIAFQHALYSHMQIGNVWIYRLLFVCLCVCVCVCLNYGFSREDKTRGVKVCMLVHGRPVQVFSHFGEL